MERLTEYRRDISRIVAKDGISTRTLLDRLAYYEDMEEQGRLQIFPCAPGATVYVTDLVDGEAVPCEVLCFSEIDGSGEMNVEYRVPKEIPRVVSILCGVDEFGKTVFLNREEAENALQAAVQTSDETPSGDCEQGGAE